MTTEPINTRRLQAKILTAAIAFGLLAGSASAEGAPPKTSSGTVRLQSVQAGFIGTASAGQGVLRFSGKSYKFKVGGLGAGGVGVSKMKASGTVYNLNSLADFEGVYGQLRTGWALGDNGRGKLWLQNTKGVVLNLNARREGLAVSAGLDGMAITFSK